MNKDLNPFPKSTNSKNIKAQEKCRHSLKVCARKQRRSNSDPSKGESICFWKISWNSRYRLGVRHHSVGTAQGTNGMVTHGVCKRAYHLRFAWIMQHIYIYNVWGGGGGVLTWCLIRTIISRGFCRRRFSYSCNFITSVFYLFRRRNIYRSLNYLIFFYFLSSTGGYIDVSYVFNVI